MRKIATSSELEWIKESTCGSAGLWSYLPNDFEAYVMIHHSIWIDNAFIDCGFTWDEWDRLQHPEKSGTEGDRLMSVSGGIGESHERTTWKRACELLGLKYEETMLRETSKSWPRYLVAPEPWLTPNELAALAQHFSTSQQCFFYYDALATAVSGGNAPDLLYDGELSELDAFVEELGFSPTYWWPRNRAWLVYTDFDHPTTVVGASFQMVKEINANPELDTLLISSEGFKT